MKSPMYCQGIHQDRVVCHHDAHKTGDYVLYWMQQSQRIHFNHALSYAIQVANAEQKPLLVYFGLTDKYPEANERHYAFMLEGLEQIAKALKDLSIGFVLKLASPPEGIKNLLPQAVALIMDKGYMRVQRQWRQSLIDDIIKAYPMPIYEIESDVLVPVTKTSNKEEYSARTIRNKIWRQADAYTEEPPILPIHIPYKQPKPEGFVDNIVADNLLSTLELDRTVKRVSAFKGGEGQGQRWLKVFAEEKLQHYELRNHPEFDYMSNMSPYLHFGQISPVYIYNTVRAYADVHHEWMEASESFIEELIIRRELAINFVTYNPLYDDFDAMTYGWAYDTMAKHVTDPRQVIYTYEDLVAARTHDPYWNASMLEMIHTGKMHTYMRMYWCKKIIEWTPDYRTAYKIAIKLNNTYFLDGRDACSYTGVAWCFGKHDRAWTERAIFGKLRYMNDNGLNRKFDMAGYLDRVKVLIEK